MFKHLSAVLLFLSGTTALSAQQLVRYVELTPPRHQVSGSLYRHFEFMDSRPDTTLIGPIQIGPFENIDARLLFKDPTPSQLEQFMAGLVDSTAQDGTLLLQLRDLSFVEPIKVRYLFIKATLYARTDSGYRKLSTFDVTDVLDMYEMRLEVSDAVNRQLDGFIAAALSRPPTDSATYTLRNIAHMDSIEEQRIPLYTAASFTDGLYLNYSSFSKQIPDRQGIIKAKRDGSIVSVHIVDTGSNKIRLKPKNLYAIVYKGKPYICTEFGYYPLERVRDNFFFTGDIRIRATVREFATNWYFFGLLGIVEMATGFETTYDLLIDPLNGKFIHLRRIDKPQTL